MEKALAETGDCSSTARGMRLPHAKVFNQCAERRSKAAVPSGSTQGRSAEHVSQYQAATQNLMAQLDKISDWRPISKSCCMFRKSVSAGRRKSAPRGIRETLGALRKTYRKSDQLIREASKPRTTKLVKPTRSDGE
jgi:hypothetical protein